MANLCNLLLPSFVVIFIMSATIILRPGFREEPSIDVLHSLQRIKFRTQIINLTFEISQQSHERIKLHFSHLQRGLAYTTTTTTMPKWYTPIKCRKKTFFITNKFIIVANAFPLHKLINELKQVYHCHYFIHFFFVLKARSEDRNLWLGYDVNSHNAANS